MDAYIRDELTKLENMVQRAESAVADLTAARKDAIKFLAEKVASLRSYVRSLSKAELPLFNDPGEDGEEVKQEFEDRPDPLDTPWSETTLRSDILKKFKAAKIFTIRDYTNFFVEDRDGKIEGVGEASQSLIDDALEQFWAEWNQEQSVV